MKITRVHLTNFRSYAGLEVPLRAWRTLVVGRNNAGKSSLRDAIRWALTGRCDGLDRGGRGVALLVRDGATSLEVRVDVAGLGSVIRRFDGKTTTLQVGTFAADDDESFDPIIRGATGDVQAAILKKLGTTEDVLEAALDSGAFLALEHGEAKDLLMRLLNVRVRMTDALRGALTDAHFDLEAIGESLTLAGLDELEKAAREKRLVAKTRLKDMGAPREPKLPATLDQAPSAASLAAKLGKLRDASEKLFAADAERRGRAGELQGQKVRLENRLRELQQRMGAVDADQIRERLEALEADRAAVIARLDREKLDALRAKIAETRGELAAAERILLAVRKHTPAKGCILDAAIPCKTPAKYFKDHVEAIEATRVTLARTIDQATADSRDIEVAALDLDKLDAEERELRRGLDGYEKAVGAWDETKRAIEALGPQLADAGAEPDPAIEAKRREIAEVETLLAAWRDHDARVKAYDQAVEKVAKYQADVDRLEALVELLGAKGLRVQALAEAVDRFERKVNGFLKAWDYALTLKLDPWTVVVNGRPVTMYSKSEKLRIGVALQLAIVEAAGLGFAFIDEADLLDKINNALLARLLMTTGIGAEGAAGQVIVAATRDDDWTPPKLAALQVVRLALDDRFRTTIAADLKVEPVSA